MGILVALGVAMWAVTAGAAAPTLFVVSPTLHQRAASSTAEAADATQPPNGQSRSIHSVMSNDNLQNRRPNIILFNSWNNNVILISNASSKEWEFISRILGEKIVFPSNKGLLIVNELEQKTSKFLNGKAIIRVSKESSENLIARHKVRLDKSHKYPIYIKKQTKHKLKNQKVINNDQDIRDENVHDKKTPGTVTTNMFPAEDAVYKLVNKQTTGEDDLNKAMLQKINIGQDQKEQVTVNMQNTPKTHSVFKRSPLIDGDGLIHSISTTNHEVTHHGTNAHTSSHHNVVVHPSKPASGALPATSHHHVVQISSLHDVDGLVTHAVIDPGLRITSTTVITHDKPLVAATPPVIEHHEVAVIPLVVKHEVVPIAHPDVAKAAIVLHPQVTHDLFRAHIGGFGVGIDFGGHGAGHGFYASSGFGFR